MNIKIVTDSSANVTADLMPDVLSVPLKISTAEQDFVDNSELNVSAMLDHLKSFKGKSSTACPSVAEWLDCFEGGDWIFALTITSKLSGCYQSACIAADTYREQHPEARIWVLDTYSTGPEMVMVIEKIQALIAEGGYTFEEVCAAVNEYQKHIHLLFSLASMNNLARNGRIPLALAKAIGFLNLRIIGLAVEGDIHPLGKARGDKKTVAQIWDKMLELGFEGGKCRISYTEDSANADALAALIRGKFPDCDLVLMPNRGLCAYYSEFGGLILGFECRQ